MGRPLRRLAEEALALPEEERLALATELIESVEGQADPDWDKAWLEELEARRKEGHGDAVPWPDARDRILSRLGNR